MILLITIKRNTIVKSSCKSLSSDLEGTREGFPMRSYYALNRLRALSDDGYGIMGTEFLIRFLITLSERFFETFSLCVLRKKC